MFFFVKRSRGGMTMDPMLLLEHMDQPTLLSVLVNLLRRHPHLIQTDLIKLITSESTLRASLTRMNDLRDKVMAAFPYTSIGRARDAYAYGRVQPILNEMYDVIRQTCESLAIERELDPTSAHSSLCEVFDGVDRMLRCIEEVPEGRWDLSAAVAEQTRWRVWEDVVQRLAVRLIRRAGALARLDAGGSGTRVVSIADVWKWAECVARWNEVSGRRLSEITSVFEHELGWLMRGLPKPTADASATNGGIGSDAP